MAGSVVGDTLGCRPKVSQQQPDTANRRPSDEQQSITNPTGTRRRAPKTTDTVHRGPTTAYTKDYRHRTPKEHRRRTPKDYRHRTPTLYTVDYRHRTPTSDDVVHCRTARSRHRYPPTAVPLRTPLVIITYPWLFRRLVSGWLCSSIVGSRKRITNNGCPKAPPPQPQSVRSVGWRLSVRGSVRGSSVADRRGTSVADLRGTSVGRHSVGRWSLYTPWVAGRCPTVGRSWLSLRGSNRQYTRWVPLSLDL